MTIPNISRSVLAGIALTLLPLGAANAGNITTPMMLLGTGSRLICIASNVSGQEITVRVTIVGTTGNSAENCTLPANDRGGCQVSRDNDTGRCVIRVTGLTDAEVFAQVRGVLFTRKVSFPNTIEGAVEAR